MDFPEKVFLHFRRETCTGYRLYKYTDMTVFSLYVKFKQYHIPVLHDILFAFRPYQAFFSGGSHAAIGNEIIIADDVCLDKSTLKI